MKTVGEILRTERKKQGKSLKQIYKETKIPFNSLLLIEKDEFIKLPSAAFVKGFLQNYAKDLNLDAEKILAFFRRDWEQNPQGEIVPKGLSAKEDKFKFSWTPKTTLIVSISFLTFLFLIYFSFQLRHLLFPPKLEVISLLDNQQVNQETVEVKGKVSEEASVYVNNQLISVENGSFSYRLKLFPGENIIEVRAVDRQGKETVVERKIIRVDKSSLILNTKKYD
jgi:cytoskeletal protein RodZ